MLKTIVLKAREEARIKRGHSWIYSNEIDAKRTPLKQFSQGEQVVVEDSRGRSLGVAMLNPQALICVRLVSRNNDCLDATLLTKRIVNALQLRERLFTKPHYRLVYGDSDFLPGLVVDRFGDYLVVQISTAGMDILKDTIVDVLTKTLSPKGILIKNDGKMRQVEGLNEEVYIAYGTIADECMVEENDVKFLVPVKSGQKTGWFFDHRQARAKLMSLVENKTVLDVFSYIGGWGIQAAVAGAKKVTCVDASQAALEFVNKNAELNACKQVDCIQGNAFDVLKSLKEQGRKFDVIILDPPAFITKRKDHKQGLMAYQRINQQAFGLLSEMGVLVSASCSLHLKREELLACIQLAANKNKREAQVIYHGYQAADHPIHPAIVETAYLKSIFAIVR